MRKLFVTMIALAAAVSAFAQFPAGLSIDAAYAANKKSVDENSGVGLDFGFTNFEIGASYNIALGEGGLGVAPGIRFGFGSGEESFLGLAQMKMKETYLAVPVLVNYSIPVGDVLKVVPFLGPTLHYGLSAKMTTSAQGQKSKTINMYDKDDDGEEIYSHFNVFVGGGVALDIAEIVRISLGYDLGLLDRSKNTDNGSIKDKGGIRLGVSYLF